ncbi:MAG: magnesium/cobalt transporter CorA, partial [Pseudomonadota bacterium]
AYKDCEANELKLLQEEFNLHELAVEDAHKGHQRPKIEEFGDSLFVVLHTMEMWKDGELEIGELHIFVGRNYVLSVRHRARQGFQNVRALCEREPELLKHGSAFVLYALMDTVVDRYFPVLHALEAELEVLESMIFERDDASAARRIIEELYSLKRRLLILQHATEPTLEAVSRLFGGRVPAVCQGMQDYFRDVYDHLERIGRAIEGRRDMVTTAIQVNLGMITLAESEVMKRLGSYAALFAVSTLIAGIYGMNFQFMPELGWKWGYPLILALMVTTNLVLWLRFKKVGWL